MMEEWKELLMIAGIILGMMAWSWNFTLFV